MQILVKLVIAVSASLGLFFTQQCFAGDGEKRTCREVLLKSGRTPEHQKVYYTIQGPLDAEPLILIHGLASSQKTFRKTISELAKIYRVIAYDQSGHGRSSGEHQDFSNRAMAEDLRALMDHLQMRSAHLLGHSLGARTVVKFSSLYPDRVKSLILEDHLFNQRKPVYPDFNSTDLETLAKFPRSFPNRSSALKSLEELTGSAAEARRLLRYKTRKVNGRILMSFYPHAIQAYKVQAQQEDLGEGLARIRKPILLLKAGRETASTAAGLEHFRRNQPSATVISLPEAGHSIHKSDQEIFVEIVTNFLEQVPAHD